MDEPVEKVDKTIAESKYMLKRIALLFDVPFDRRQKLHGMHSTVDDNMQNENKNTRNKQEKK